MAFATYFGSVFQPPSDVPVLASGPGGATPEIVRVSNIDGYTGTGELSPHSDHHWTPFPSAASLLYALEVPDVGGDTSFYNMNLAYETLDEAALHSLVPQYNALPCVMMSCRARTVSSMGVCGSGRWQKMMST